MPTRNSKPSSPITAAVADPADGWAAFDAAEFVPDALAADERTAAMHAAIVNPERVRKGLKPISAARADVLLRNGFLAGKLQRRRVRLTRLGGKQYAYRPVTERR